MTHPLLIRPATLTDVPVLLDLIQALADYEKLSHLVTATPENLAAHLFGDRSFAEALIAEFSGLAVGYALFFHNYSTFLAQPGMYLEDLFVLPDYRRKGIGKAMFSYLAQIASERNCGRLEWSVLDWNQSAIAFYESLGADVLPDWRICRLRTNNRE